MMFATPVRSSAWSSTISTLATAVLAAVSDCSMARCRNREGGRFPGQDDFGARSGRRHDGERRANPLGAFLHARHPKSRPAVLLGDAAAVVGNRQTESDGTHG